MSRTTLASCICESGFLLSVAPLESLNPTSQNFEYLEVAVKSETIPEGMLLADFLGDKDRPGHGIIVEQVDLGSSVALAGIVAGSELLSITFGDNPTATQIEILDRVLDATPQKKIKVTSEQLLVILESSSHDGMVLLFLPPCPPLVILVQKLTEPYKIIQTAFDNVSSLANELAKGANRGADWAVAVRAACPKNQLYVSSFETALKAVH